MVPQNLFGFGTADVLVLAAAGLLVLIGLAWRPRLEFYARKLADRAAWSMLFFFLAPIVLRLLLLPNHPVPTPDVYDEFGHLLMADTLRHFRLANPPHPDPQFFETFFVLQEPRYASIYPAGPGLILAVGWTLLGTPWAGVLIGIGAFCALCYWMLRAWTTPGWAFAGGLLAVIEFGPLNQWSNDYWGGGLAASAGCLVFGALPRLGEKPRTRDAVLLGLGLGLHIITRQFESLFLIAGVLLYWTPILRRPAGARAALAPMLKVLPELVLTLLPFLALTVFQNKAVTGSWTTLPEQLSQYQYGVPASLTFQPHVTPHRDLTPQQQMDYRMQRGFRGEKPETLVTYLERLEYRVRFYRFFFLPPLYLALIAFLFRLREWRFLWVALTAAIFALGTNFFPAFQLHYVAAVACLFVLMSVAGLETIGRIVVRGQPAGLDAMRFLAALCAAHFLFWYGLHLAEPVTIAPELESFETWDAINHGNPQRRVYINHKLATMPGKLLVFVRYNPARHVFQDEWVYNRADIDGSRIVFARDLGTDENEKLRQYYPDRSVWLLEPDFPVPQLTRFPRPTPSPFINVQ
ncbi:MAG TPA: hypothetical protein VML19_00445 [Verrucomicrobiae bacterium]|nr:hypothetical protein [Verrucomicrobiae bacterium]